ncbi:YgiW/YdeI family stress tolerance OB fold protein [Shewanella donghaensis]|uniref:YgiW/YdeI family stress tolerance OB fold protein n=1 Tax=Shewanella donghaensis TaxID=238836 RepID=UPI001183EDA8|nr:NirD/YgiW/YdeI family stress tolerance protein [Shewanella donghaensis]
MKKLLVCGLLFASTTAVAASNVNQGGFLGPTRGSVDTIDKALEAKDDTPAVLTGYIVESLGDEEYRFRDDSGEMIVEIDDKNWKGIEATPETKLTLLGEIDSKWSTTNLDVDTVRLAD